MSTHSRAVWQDWYNRQITKWFMEGMEEGINGKRLLYTQAANLETLNNPKDLVGTFVGGGLYARHGEMTPTKLYRPGDGWRIGFDPHIYRSGFEVSDYATQYGDNGMVAKQERLLGYYGIESLDHVFVNMLNKGFDTAYPIYDGQPLFSLSHPLKNAPGVFANMPATGGPITQDSLAEAYVYFSNMPNDDGMRYSMDPAILVIHPDQIPSVMQVLNSPSPLTAPNPNVKSIIAGLLDNLVVVTSPKIADPRNWFVLSARSKVEGAGHGLSLYFTPIGKPKTRTYSREDPDALKYVGAFQVAPTIMKARGVYGNRGY